MATLEQMQKEWKKINARVEAISGNIRGCSKDTGSCSSLITERTRLVARLGELKYKIREAMNEQRARQK
jgi:hypothetical protein